MKLEKQGLDLEQVKSLGDTFVIGNGHLGYRGTLEEYTKSQGVGLNIVGFYDRYSSKWRESVNVANPIYIKSYFNDKCLSVLENTPLNHNITLDTEKRVFSRKTEFDDAIITSSRFVSATKDNLIGFEYKLTAKSAGEYSILAGIDALIDEINGTHFATKKVYRKEELIIFEGQTNESKVAYVKLKLICDSDYIEKKEENYRLTNEYKKNLEAGESICLVGVADIEANDFIDETIDISSYELKDYLNLKDEHIKECLAQWSISQVVIDGPKDAQEGLDYSIYQLLSIAPHKYITSIPARGVSGQTYKGAIFWDTEVFMLPFYILTNPSVARGLVEYRIKGLKGAKKKAKDFGFRGAFYAWESQEEGYEACSLYNITDAKTGEPIRTYFADKQIHISADVIKALFDYSTRTNDYTLLNHGGLEAALEVARFYLSYSSIDKNGVYHLNDVIGPDEYHERINDNTFTNYLVKDVISKTLKYFNELKEKSPYKASKLLTKIKMSEKELDDIIKFENNIYIPSTNDIIEQFNGYFALEDVKVEDVRKRLTTANEYWGKEASKTRVIKQADVITLLALYPRDFSLDIAQRNFNFYEPYTEHGSSLSASMHSLVASRIGLKDKAYQFFMKTALADLGESTKKYAGGIYIGGTHPAANGGAYLSAIFGFAGLTYDGAKIKLQPHLPTELNSLTFKFYENKKVYEANVTKDSYIIKEVKL